MKRKVIAACLTASMLGGLVVGCGKKPTPTTEQVLTPPETQATESEIVYTNEAGEPTINNTDVKDTEPIPEDIYCLDGMTPDEIVKMAVDYAVIKDGDTFIDIYNKFSTKPYNIDASRLDKYDAYGVNFEWNNYDFKHDHMNKFYVENSSYQYEDHKQIDIKANSCIRLDFYFQDVEQRDAVAKAFYNYLVSLGEINPELTDDINVLPEKTAGAYAWKITYKTYEVADTRNFTTDSCRWDRETEKDYYTESYIIIELTDNYLTVDIPVNGYVYQGGL